MQSAFACACLVMLAASVVRRAVATCDQAVVDKIKAMHPDNDQFASVIDQLPGKYEVMSISIQNGTIDLKKRCLKLTITKADGKTVIEFKGILAYPLIFKDGKLEYTGEKRVTRNKDNANAKDSEKKEGLTISYYIVHHSPKAVSFYTCSDQIEGLTLAFTAVPVAHITVGDAEEEAKQATKKLKEVGVTKLAAVAHCKHSNKTHKTAGKHDQRSELGENPLAKGNGSKQPSVTTPSHDPPKPKSPKNTEQDKDAQGN